jgi:hypothetical protein
MQDKNSKGGYWPECKSCFETTRLKEQRRTRDYKEPEPPPEEPDQLEEIIKIMKASQRAAPDWTISKHADFIVNILKTKTA